LAKKWVFDSSNLSLTIFAASVYFAAVGLRDQDAKACAVNEGESIRAR